MRLSLTPAQSIVLRRCSGGLRVWEGGSALAAILVELRALMQFKLVSFDEDRGYETTAAGEAWLVEFDE